MGTKHGEAQGKTGNAVYLLSLEPGATPSYSEQTDSCRSCQVPGGTWRDFPCRGLCSCPKGKKVKAAQWCPTFMTPMEYTVRGISSQHFRSGVFLLGTLQLGLSPGPQCRFLTAWPTGASQRFYCGAACPSRGLSPTVGLNQTSCIVVILTVLEL